MCNTNVHIIVRMQLAIEQPHQQGILYSHYRDVANLPWLWENFEPWEFACRHCGELFWQPYSLDCIQALRDRRKRPVHLNSAHRCWAHNLRVRGAPQSQHLHVAFDVPWRDESPTELLSDMKSVGFRSIGLYETFIHGDIRPGRLWYGSKAARAMWTGLLHQIQTDIVL